MTLYTNAIYMFHVFPY